MSNDEVNHALEFLLSEASGTRSREKGVLASGNNLKAGAVLGLNGAGKYEEYDPDEYNTGDAVAILAGDINAASADQDCAVLTRDCEVAGDLLTWPSGISAGEKTAAIADLATRGVIVR